MVLGNLVNNHRGRMEHNNKQVTYATIWPYADSTGLCTQVTQPYFMKDYKLTYATDTSRS